jgi:hypothetical protein
MFWTLQNLNGRENKQSILQYDSIFSAATVLSKATVVVAAHQRVGFVANTLYCMGLLGYHNSRQDKHSLTFGKLPACLNL